ncbi:MAG: c-type cytochrome [Bauldia sp.]|nr:c-type cytochrome [Bauldia sp.]
MSNGESPRPSDQDAVNRRWRLWASTGAGAIVVVAIVIGFFVISSRGEGGVTGALGLDHVHETPEAVAQTAAGALPTDVAWTAATLGLLEDADPEAGRAIAVQTCASCHGEAGIAVAAAFPNLAGQPATAIFKQLSDYASGHRVSPMMAAMAQGLTAAQMADLAVHFAAETPAESIVDANPPAAIVQLVVNGDPARGLPPCSACHSARGGPVGTPPLGGQPAAYLEQQLTAFAAGERGNDIYGLMRAVAGMLTPAEIAQLAAYYGN